MENNQKILCTLHGGSHLYGLNTPTSDIDYRGVFCNTHYSYILGTKRFDEERRQNPDTQDDYVMKELNHFMNLLKMANSEALEILFAPEDVFTFIDDSIKEIRANRYSLIDSNKLFKCLCGYMQGELKLALGERRGRIGGKRYEQVIQYGFSPKNMCQLLRLSYMGMTFFKADTLPVRLEGSIKEQLLDIKVNPQNYTADQLTKQVITAEEEMKSAYDDRVKDHHFSEQIANELLYKIYLPFLIKT